MQLNNQLNQSSFILDLVFFIMILYSILSFSEIKVVSMVSESKAPFTVDRRARASGDAIRVCKSFSHGYGLV